VCGDGVMQDGEVCDGDTEAGFCDRCKAIVPPSISFEVGDFRASAIESYTSTSSSSYIIGYRGTVAGKLPIAGDSRGCGAVKILESTAEYIRLEWTHCGDGDVTATVTFALPRTKVSYKTATGLPTSLQATIRLAKASIGKEITWTTPGAVTFELSSSPPPTTGGPPQIFSNVRFLFERPDPTLKSRTASASLMGFIEFVPPVVK
jgi:hypothetical protein